MSTVSQVGTATSASSTSGLTPAVTGTWGTGQNRTAGNLLAAVVTAYGNTTAYLGDPPAGWSLSGMSHAGTAGTDLTAVFFKTAAGSDAAPVFTAVMTGTAADCRLDVTLYEYSDSGGGTPVLATTGTAQGTSGTTLTATTRLNVLSGSVGLAAITVSQGTTAATATWTPPAGWTAEPNATASHRAQFAIWSLASPTAGSTLAAALPKGRTTTTNQAGIIAVISPAGSAQPMYVDSVKSASTAGVTTTQSFTHVTLAASCALVVNVSAGDQSFSGTGKTISGVTCDGTAMTSLHADQQSGSPADNGGFVRQFGLAGVGTGSHSIVVTVSGGALDLNTSSAAFTPADASSPFGTPAAASGSSAAPSATLTGAAGNLIAYVSCFGALIGTGPTGPFRTFAKSLNSASGGGGADHGAAIATGSSQAVATKIPSDDWALIATEILAPSGGGGTSVPLAEAGSGADALGLAAGVALAESGAGADTLAVSIPVALGEAGAGADALAVTVVMPAALSEAGAGADALALTVPASLAGAGTGADALSLAAGVALGEAGAGSDQLAVSQPAALAESGAGSDALALSSQASLAESGAGADVFTAAVPTALAEAGTGADALAVTQPTALSEAGAGSDSLGVMPGLSEAGTGSDALSVTVASPVALSDAGTGSDALSLSAGAALGESGSGADALALAAGVALPEAGAGADALALAQPTALAEAGAGADVLTVGAAEDVALTEAGSGADQLALAAGVALAETGAGADALAVTATVALAEAGSGADALALAIPVALAEAGAGADALALAAPVALTEAGAGADALSVSSSAGPVIITDTDSCHAEDSGFTFLTGTDGCTGTDGGEVIRISDSDRCTATEASLTRWVTDTDSCRASELSLSANKSDSDGCAAADGGERIKLADSDACAAADDSSPVGVWTYVPPFHTGPGGGFEVVIGRRVVIRARHAGLDVLQFARRLHAAREVRWVHDADHSDFSESENHVTGVTMVIEPALELGIEIIRSIV